MLASTQQIAGRNAPCPCGSGRKFKRCCRVVVRPAAAREIRLARLPHQTTEEMRDSRKIGLQNLYDENLTAAQLWGYMRTGQVFRAAAGFTPVMRGQWSMAMEEFTKLFGLDANREMVLSACINELTSEL